MNKKTISLVAHDGMKNDLVEWVKLNNNKLLPHKLVCTGTTGKLIEQTLSECCDKELDITRLKSGPLGGDQQLGAMLAEDKIDLVIFLCDPMTAQPHDVDVKALIRLASVYNVPMALNLSTADFLITSPLFSTKYNRVVKDYGSYIHRGVSNKQINKEQII